jgi:hypothetical protein
MPRIKIYSVVDKISSDEWVTVSLDNFTGPHGGVVLNVPRVLKAGWSVQSKEDVMAEFGFDDDWLVREIDQLPVPEWMKKAAWYVNSTYVNISSSKPMKDYVAIDAVVALGQTGRVLPAHDPIHKDVWFLFASPDQGMIFIYNGNQILPCKLAPSEEKPGYDEIWIDLHKVMTSTNEDRQELDGMINEYAEQE